MTVQLDTPFSYKNLELKNRIVMPPMCQYAVEEKDGTPTEWHYVHYVSRAVGGTGLMIIEMTNVEPDGRITDNCLGLWADDQIPAYKRIIEESKKYGAKVAIQIAHAGRKAQDAPQPVAPSAIAYDDTFRTPRELTTQEVKEMVDKFADAARRAVEAGVDTIELHGAHGYLIHQFHSPYTNQRTDEYGRDKSLFGVEIIQAVKRVMPEGMPLIMRISAVEYVDGGYDLDYALEIGRRYKEAGVDIFDISTGGEGAPGARKPANTPGFQVPYAKAFKDKLGVPVIAVGLLEDPQLAAQTLRSGDADMIGVARGMLRNPYWALAAIKETTGRYLEAAPKSYDRAY
ncbi:NADH:flavin oxidoreductase/NADH oxidase [Paenibacillus tarimensis]|uniref:NADH:flavin oxidoreductase/NADH oxidase n=1 Tax=Paenibacillus tarimensis TaxID=416012 RepID=UPI001F23B9B3|nr:NADH:flavin oxidoreductase/NADH oxidase [Paenibacillus tarimensis]MCF2943621.1 NADH:flavin oxidoreductase/NADH oxidase [Paenibacillus tarimensis]